MSVASKLWAGRFSQETDALVHQFNASLAFDARLWAYDIRGSIAHVKMLGECGIIPASESQQIAQGLDQLAADLHSGAAALPADAEDVHMAVETLLTRRLGPVAGKLHTARSRNDQVATDLRLYVKDAVTEGARPHRGSPRDACRAGRKASRHAAAGYDPHAACAAGAIGASLARLLLDADARRWAIGGRAAPDGCAAARGRGAGRDDVPD